MSAEDNSPEALARDAALWRQRTRWRETEGWIITIEWTNGQHHLYDALLMLPHDEIMAVPFTEFAAINARHMVGKMMKAREEEGLGY